MSDVPNGVGDTARGGSAGGRPWKPIALVVVAAALTIFVVQNDEEAFVRFLWFDGSWPVWLVIAVSVVAGVLLDRLGTWQWRRARRRDEPAA